jgi:hypothetical protein
MEPNARSRQQRRAAERHKALNRLFLCRAFASSDFGSFRELVVIVCNPQHDRLGGSLFRGVSKRTRFLTPRAPMIWIISQQARDRRWCVTQHSAERSSLRRIVNPVLTQSWVSIVTTMRLCRASFRCHPVAHASRTLHFAELVPLSRTNIADEMREEASAASALRLMVEN